MEELVSAEDWEALQGLLAHGVKVIEGKQVEAVKLAILEFYSTASMLGLEDIADVAKKFEDFLLQKVAPGWGGEATATLSFSMGGLLEKMQLNKYSPQFSSGLSEILMFMEFYEEDEPSPPATPQEKAVPAAAPPVAPEPVPEPPLPEIDLSELGLSAVDDDPLETGTSLLLEEDFTEDIQEPALPALTGDSNLHPAEEEVTKPEKGLPARAPAAVPPARAKPTPQKPGKRA